MGNQTSDLTQGPYRISRTREQSTVYFAGHHENGQVHWTVEENKGVRYPTHGLADTAKKSLKHEPGDMLNVVRIDT